MSGCFALGAGGCSAAALGPGRLIQQKHLCMGVAIRDHGSAAGAGLRSQPADGECAGEEVGPSSAHSSLPLPQGLLLTAAAAAMAADTESTARLHPAGSSERISGVRGLA